MSIRLSSAKMPAITLAIFFVAYLLFGWLAFPRIIQSQAQQYVTEKTGHRLTLDRPEFNPFSLSLRVPNLHLEEPDGKALFSFRDLTVELSLSSLFRRALIFNSIRLDGPQAALVLQRDGQLNWTALIEALKGKEVSKEETHEASMPRLSIQSFILTGGQLDFADNNRGFATRVKPIELELSDISTLPDDKDRYKISARTAFGARVLWQGQAMLNPLSIGGSFAIDNLDLARLARYLTDALPARQPAGVASLSTDYRLAYTGGRLDLALENVTARIADFQLNIGRTSGPEIAVRNIQARNGRFDLAERKLALGSLALEGSRVNLPGSGGTSVELLQLGTLTLDGAKVDMAGRTVAVGGILLKDGRLKAVRNGRGRIDVLDALNLAARPAAGTKSEPKTSVAPWHYHLDKLELAGFSANFRDQSLAPAADLALDDIAVSVDGISDNLSAALPVRVSLRAREGGSFEAIGNVVPGEPSADFHLKLAGLALKAAQPYLTSVAKLKLVRGQFAAEGHASYGKRGARYKGGFALSNLRLVEADTNDDFLAWKFVGSRDLEVTPARLEIGRLDIDRLYTKLIIDKDRSFNVTHILRKRETVAAPSSSAPETTASAAPEKETPPFLVNIDRMRISKGEMDYADYSLVLPFATRIHKLRGFVDGLSLRPGAPGQIELDGEVDDYGVARAIVQIDPFNPADFTDIKVMFGNVEMTRLTPYSTTFAGRKIDSGKLSVNVTYKIHKHQLEGDNQVVIEKLTLGERVESPEAKNLPLDLAIAILQDSEGRIDVALPVSGSLDDPHFSYGSVIWKAILEFFGKIATAPFRALAALFGGEKIQNAHYDAGVAKLSPPERENIINLAGVLNKRPGLSMTVHGVYADADRGAIQDLQLRRAVAAKAGEPVEEDRDPGPISTASPKVQAALESLFSERFGGAELAAIKGGFRKANPGQLEQGIGGKMMSRLSGLFRKERTLSEHEVEQLKGADFFAVLYRRLRDREIVSDEQLASLSRARGENTYEALKAAGAPADRLALAESEKVDADLKGVPVKLDLGTAPKPGESAPAPN